MATLLCQVYMCIHNNFYDKFATFFYMTSAIVEKHARFWTCVFAKKKKENGARTDEQWNLPHENLS